MLILLATWAEPNIWKDTEPLTDRDYPISYILTFTDSQSQQSDCTILNIKKREEVYYVEGGYNINDFASPTYILASTSDESPKAVLSKMDAQIALEWTLTFDMTPILTDMMVYGGKLFGNS